MTKRQVSEMFGGGMEIGSLHTLCPAVSQAHKHCVASTTKILTSVNTFSQAASANMANSLSPSLNLTLSPLSLSHTNIEYI